MLVCKAQPSLKLPSYELYSSIKLLAVKITKRTNLCLGKDNCLAYERVVVKSCIQVRGTLVEEEAFLPLVLPYSNSGTKPRYHNIR